MVEFFPHGAFLDRQCASGDALIARYRSSRQFGRQGRFHKFSSLFEWQTCLLCCTQKPGPSAMVDTHKLRSVVKFYSLDSQRNLGLPGILKNSSCIELECGTTPAGRRRSSSILREVSDDPLSSQSVYEQTSGVLQHTESVRCDKVQEQDWDSDIQVRTLRTLADSRSNDPARSQASVSSRTHRKFPALPPRKQSLRRWQGPGGPQRSEGSQSC